ncbi:MAG: 2OG-Fe(II) oxygenase [Alphaproteobacteria bacterium]|nr:MAG: 2OG-Fe(II) oxygenase [Alphaproteobacteria bacterium]
MSDRQPLGRHTPFPIPVFQPHRFHACINHPGALTPEECAQWRDFALSHLELHQAKIGRDGGDSAESAYRRSRVGWLPNEPRTAELFRKLASYVMSTNRAWWNFDLTEFAESLQFTEYSATDEQFYNWHVDPSPANPNRKLSMVVQLSAADSYEGGDLEVMTSSVPTRAPRQQGTIVFFPSYNVHRVTPVTKGVRHSLVGWIHGPPLR